MSIQQNIDNDFLTRNNINLFRHQAMNTIFELYITDEEKDYSSQAAHEVFKEIDIIENDLSKFLPNSDISNINNMPINDQLIVGEHAFECLKDCEELYNITSGVFNVALGRIINHWKENEQPDPQSNTENDYPAEFALLLNDKKFGVAKKSNVLIDLGGYGKGYAIDKSAELLKEWSINSFLISGGNSTVLAYDSESRIEGWPISISDPVNNNVLKQILIQNISVSGSGLVKGQHIIDPRNQQPSERIAAWAACQSAAWSDAFSTTFIIMDLEGIGKVCNDHKIDALLIGKDEKGISTESIGDMFTIV